VQHLHSLQQLLRRQATQRSPPRHWVVSRILDSSAVGQAAAPGASVCNPHRTAAEAAVNDPLLGETLLSASRYTLRLWRRPGLAPPWVVAGTSWAKRRGVFEQKTTRAGNSSWCVMPGRTRYPARRRSGAASRRPVEPRRRVVDVVVAPRTRAFASQPPAPGWAAVRPARIADLGMPTPLREGVNPATPTMATQGESCPGRHVRICRWSHVRPTSIRSVVCRADRGWEISGACHGDHRERGPRAGSTQGRPANPGLVRSCGSAFSGAGEVRAGTSRPRSGGSGLDAPRRGHRRGRARGRWPRGAPVRLARPAG
jgi:hypothetical protein